MNALPSRTALLLGGRLEPRALESFDLRGALRRLAPPLLFGVAVLGAWQLYVALSGVRETILPSPIEVGRALVRDRSVLAPSAWTTLEEVLLGYAIAVALGVLLALVVSSSRVAERAIYPWLVISQLIPIPAIAPLVVIWTGFDIRPKLIIIALVSFFPVAVNTIDGLRATDPDLLDLLRSLGAGRWQRLRLARAPSALPSLFSGLRVAAALAVIGAVFAEWVGSSSGLGYLILSYNAQTATPDVFAAVVILAVIGVALFAAVGLLERVALPWYRAESEVREGA
jgi:ABC-type nitrate/sulfonate/bicarbonate transport system permease component